MTKVHRSVPDNFDPGQKDYLTCVARLEKEKGYFSKDEIYETKNWFIITYEAGKLIYNKKMEKAFYMPKNVAMRGDMIYPDDLWGEYGEKLVAVYTPEELLARSGVDEESGATFPAGRSGKEPCDDSLCIQIDITGNGLGCRGTLQV